MLQARSDLALAALARDNDFHAQACFFASRAAKKAQKGVILELGAEAPTHARAGAGDLIERADSDLAIGTAEAVMAWLVGLDQPQR